MAETDRLRKREQKNGLGSTFETLSSVIEKTLKTHGME